MQHCVGLHVLWISVALQPRAFNGFASLSCHAFTVALNDGDATSAAFLVWSAANPLRVVAMVGVCGVVTPFPFCTHTPTSHR